MIAKLIVNKHFILQVYDQLTPEERRRNARGDNYLFLRKSHKGYAFLRGLYENKSQRMLNDTVEHAIPPESYNGMAGTALTTDKVSVTMQFNSFRS